MQIEAAREDANDAVKNESQIEPDAFLPGKLYKGPERLVLSRGRITRSIETTSQVIIRYFLTTALPCPCEQNDCTKLINVGKWGVVGGGSTVCVHCGTKREGDWEGAGYGFMGKEYLIRHLNSASCRAKRGLKTQKQNVRHVLGPLIYNKINNLAYMVKRSKKGRQQQFYKCYVCETVVGYRSRYMHHINTKHERESEGEKHESVGEEDGEKDGESDE